MVQFIKETSDVRPTEDPDRAKLLKRIVKELVFLPFDKWPHRAHTLEKEGIRREIIREGINILAIEMTRRDLLDDWGHAP